MTGWWMVDLVAGGIDVALRIADLSDFAYCASAVSGAALGGRFA